MPPPIYIVSGGKGLAGEQVVRSVLAQYPAFNLPVLIIPDVRTAKQIEKVVNEAEASGGLIVHTMVDDRIRAKLKQACHLRKVDSVDLMGGLIAYLNRLLGAKPLRRPGLYRQTREEYFDRVEAMEFAVACDDGLNARMLSRADLVLTGASRTGKTPLSMYLAMSGWKVGNVPLIQHIPPPPELFKLDRRRVFGVTISPGQLIEHRRRRLEQFGQSAATAYTDRNSVRNEIDYALALFRRGGFTVIDVTDQPIESIASEIVELIAKRFKSRARRRGSRKG